MHGRLSLLTKPTVPPIGRSAFHVARRGKRGANESEPLRGESAECSPSFLAAIARELSTVRGDTVTEHRCSARRVLIAAFDAVEMPSVSSCTASSVRRTLAGV